jgi:hypothetical protein
LRGRECGVRSGSAQLQIQEMGGKGCSGAWDDLQGLRGLATFVICTAVVLRGAVEIRRC